MKKALLLVGLVAFLVLVAGAIRWLFPGDAARIRKLIRQTSEDVSTYGTETGLARITRAQRIANRFATNLVVTGSFDGQAAGGISSRDELFQLLIAAQGNIPRVEVEVSETQIGISEEGDEAEVSLVAKINYPERNEVDFQPLKFRLRKTDEGWKISQVEAVDTMRLPTTK